MRLQHYLTQEIAKSESDSHYAITDDSTGTVKDVFSTDSSGQMRRWLSQHNYMVPTKMSGPQESYYEVELYTAAQFDAVIADLKEVGHHLSQVSALAKQSPRGDRPR